MMVRTLAGFGIIGVLVLGNTASPREAAAAINLSPVLSGLTSPIFVTNAGDGSNRLFVVEQAGIIKVVQPGSATPTVFLDVHLRVLSGGERGLLGLAFHPQYATNRRFFVYYTRQTDGAIVLSEFRASANNPNVADPAEIVFFVIPHPAGNHNGGMIEFGPDGFLYVGTGDGGGGNDPGDNGQNIDTLLGKVLRIDVNQPNGAVPYSSPSSNPFSGPTAGADEIYAYGFRNPWRFSFDRANGALYLGDVGQGVIEEIDLVVNGGNYGWRTWEGTRCTGNDPGPCDPEGFVFPITEYSHTGGRCSVTGGYVYRGTQSSLPVGSYVFGDFCTGEIFLYQGGAASLLLDSTLALSSFGEDEAGELYVVGIGGTVHRIIQATAGVSSDFDGNLKADILWRHAGGTVAVWLMNGVNFAGAGTTGHLPTDWTIVGRGDFDADGKTDILWHRTGGDVAVWLMNGPAATTMAAVGNRTTDWRIVGVGDFDGDARADVLWRHTSGALSIWFMNGTTMTGSGSPSAVANDWTVVGVGDFSGDGKADILWRHTTGTLFVWLLNGATVIGAGSPGSVGNDWSVAGVGDFNTDGKSDVLWRHTSGSVSIWLLSGTGLLGSGSPGLVGNDWRIVGCADFNGDGRSDILWRHTSGAVHVWLINGTAISGSGTPGTVDMGWVIQ
jgi:hypothetical protein